jgi:hypothetical protein
MILQDKLSDCIEFTYAQAIQLLPRVISVTETAVVQIQTILNQFVFNDIDAEEYEMWRKDVFSILDTWEMEILRLGLIPEAYFVVDFKSTTPTLLFCWAYGDHTIDHVHLANEKFLIRRRIKDTRQIGFEENLN